MRTVTIIIALLIIFASAIPSDVIGTSTVNVNSSETSPDKEIDSESSFVKEKPYEPNESAVLETKTDDTTELYLPKEHEKCSSYIIRDIPYISQMPDYPNGCEIISTIMVLNYFGFEISADEFIRSYLPMGSTPTVHGLGPDPNCVFCGNPRRTDGWGCNASVIGNSLNKMEIFHEFPTENTLSELCEKYLANSVPIIVWVTKDMIKSDFRSYVTWHTSDGKTINYNINQHCMVLVGYDEKQYYFLDPLCDGDENHITTYERGVSEEAFSVMGCQSLMIMKGDAK